MHLNIREIIKAKAPNKKVPSFIVNYLRKIAHEDELNRFFPTVADKKNVEFIEGSLKYLRITATIEGKENLPKDGKCYIFASNHPLGGLDGLILGMLIGKEYNGKVKYVVNDLLMNLTPLSEMFIPVNKVGAQGKNNVELMNQLYESDNQIITFPAGACSRKVNGVITDLEWKKNFIAKAIAHQRDVVPIFFEGRNSNFFYNLSRIRKSLGIKLNIEMLYLVDEMYKQCGKHLKARIGKLIPWQTFDKTKSQAEWAEWVKKGAYSLEIKQKKQHT